MRKNIHVSILLLFAGFTLLISGCSLGKSVIGKEKVVETSGKKSKWVTSEDLSFTEKDKMFFRGHVGNVYDLSLGRRQAEADAQKHITEKIAKIVETEFTAYGRGANMSKDDIGKFAADGIAWVSEKVVISGSEPVKQYWEKIEATTEGGVKYLYNIYVLVQLSVDDYNRARDRAINGLAEKARIENNKKAEEAAANLLKRLRSEKTEGN